MISGFFKCILIFCSVCPLFHKGVKKAEILKGKRNCVCSSTTATKSATSFLVPRDTSERVALVPIFYFIKNQSPAPLFLSSAKRHGCAFRQKNILSLGFFSLMPKKRRKLPSLRPFHSVSYIFFLAYPLSVPRIFLPFTVL